jgi:hypothetical protein
LEPKGFNAKTQSRKDAKGKTKIGEKQRHNKEFRILLIWQFFVFLCVFAPWRLGAFALKLWLWFWAVACHCTK